MVDPPEDALNFLDEVGDRFEDALRRGEELRIEDYLAGTGSMRRPVLRLLIEIEIEHRMAAGEDVSRGEYERRFPFDLDVVTGCFEGGGRRPGCLMSGAAVSRAEIEFEESGLPELPGFEVRSLIGRGGMGAVYLAWQVRLERLVAVKVLLSKPQPGLISLEACLVAKVRSPYVVTVFDCPTLSDGRHAIVMEFVEGGSLDRIIADRVAGESEVRRWMIQVCEGMLAAAAEGIVHLDLKPGNILIDRNQDAKVSDFGLARSTASPEGHTPLPSVGGTPLYMAPEQADDPRAIDTRTDIYSFGATFYHALTGIPPFAGNSTNEILTLHKYEPLTPTNVLNQDLSTRMSEVIERCLAKNPADRFASFAELRAALLDDEGSVSPWEMADAACSGIHWDAYCSRRSDYLVRRIAEGGETYLLLDGRRRLEIKRGDILLEEADAIVNSTSNELDFEFNLSRALAEAAGDAVRHEWYHFRSARLRPGRAIVTTAGKLPARFVFHAMTLGIHGRRYVAPSRDLIIELLRSCFYQADALGIRSIAFPLLGTGAGGFPEDVCLDTMFRFLIRVLSGSATSVRRATIVLFDPSHSVGKSFLGKRGL